MRPKREITIAARHGLCLFPVCDRTGDEALGLCRSHYRQLNKYINDGLFTLEQLERKGKIISKAMTLKDWLKQ